MRDYGKVSPRFWTGPTGKQIRAAGPDATIVALYLQTAPGSTMSGLYYLPLPTLAHETGIPIEGASKALRSLSEARFAHYDEAHEVVWVVEMARHQIGDRLDPRDKRIAGVVREVAAFAKCPLFQDFYRRYREPFHLPDPKPLGSPFEGPPKPRAGAGTRAACSPPDKPAEPTPPPDPPAADKPTSGRAAKARARAAQMLLVGEPPPRKPPADVVELLALLERASGGRFAAGDAAGWSRGHVIRVRKMRAAYPDLAAWQALGEWWGEGGDEHRGDTITIDAVAGDGCGPSMTRAQRWAAAGKGEVDARFKRRLGLVAPPRPSVDQPVFVSDRRDPSPIAALQATPRKASNE